MFTGPEHPFPAAGDDAWAVVQAVLGNGCVNDVDCTRICISGDSAGGQPIQLIGALTAVSVSGQLTILCCLLARDAGLAHRIAFALPLVPATDFRPLAREDNTDPSASINAYKEGHLISKAKIIWFSDCYVKDGNRADWRLSVVTADLSQLPAMTVMNCLCCLFLL